MTEREYSAQSERRGLPLLPDPPPKGFVPFRHFVLPNVPGTLARHLEAYPYCADSTTLVSGRGYICRSQEDIPLCPVPDPIYPDPRHPDTNYPYPDMVVAFDVDPGSIIKANGYIIDDVGKPPDLVLDVGTSYNGRRECAGLRKTYARLGIPEYWRFDHTGGRYHDAGLACDLLTDGGYQPMPLTTEPGGVVWGYSEVLGLSVCWVAGTLRFWDRQRQRYLTSQRELETRVRELEEELRRREGA